MCLETSVSALKRVAQEAGVELIISRTVAEVRSHDIRQLPGELKRDVHLLGAMWMHANLKAAAWLDS